MKFLKGFRRLATAPAITALMIVGLASAQTPGKDQAAKPAQESASSQYVGDDTCKTCHEDIFNGLRRLGIGTAS